MVLLVMQVVLFAGFAVASVFFALAETALFSLRRWQVRQLLAKSPQRGALVQELLARPQDLLAGIVLCNTVANAFLVALIIWAVPPQAHYFYPCLAGAFLFILLGGEAAPKTLAVRNSMVWALRVAPAMRCLLQITQPVQRLAERLNHLILRATARRAIKPQTGLTPEEYQELVEMAFQQGTLRAAEKEIISRIIALGSKTVQEVMKSRSQMACIPDDLTVDEMLAAARRHKHHRLPMYDDTPDTIVGILNTQALLQNPEMDLADAIEFPSFVPGTMNLLRLFRSFQRQSRGVAIVLDEFGGTAGIVTMQDVLEEVVGQIRGEGEPEGFVLEKLAPGKWRVNGTMRLEDFRREYPKLAEGPPVETMGGLAVALAEVTPAVGDVLEFRGLRLKVLAADERRVRELLVETIPARGKGVAA